MNSYNIENLQSIDPIEFENLVITLLIKMGFNAATTKTTGDGGIDIVAINEQPIVGGKYVIQCKRYATGNNVGEPAIRELFGIMHAENANKGILITTSEFSKHAITFAEDKAIELINVNALLNLFKRYLADEEINITSYISEKETEKYISHFEQFQKECDLLLKKETFSIKSEIRNIPPEEYHKFLKKSYSLTSNDIDNGMKSPTIMDEFSDIGEYFTDLLFIFTIPLKTINDALSQAGHHVKDRENEHEELYIKWSANFKDDVDTVVKISFIDDYIKKTLKVYREFKKVIPQEHPTLVRQGFSQLKVHNTYILQLEAVFRGLRAVKELMVKENPLLIKFVSDTVNLYLEQGEI
jgi:hypothetical protein